MDNFRPSAALPYSDAFSSTEAYIESLLHLVTTDDLLRTLCGGVHVLDFFTSDPPLYDQVLPLEWREYFDKQEDVMDVLNLLMHDDLEQLRSKADGRDEALPPESLMVYISTVRKHLLDREPRIRSQCMRNRDVKKLSRRVAVGMNVKKVHEVGLFASYVDDLATHVSEDAKRGITHLVDFGSGQSYLGRALASEPYERQVIAIESKESNGERAKFYDEKARLVEKRLVWRNKKAFRAGTVPRDEVVKPMPLPTPPPEEAPTELADHSKVGEGGEGGSLHHISHRIVDGDLSYISTASSSEPHLIVIALHSCGNLLHHGLRSLTLNPVVKAVALVGCCYNLLTERLGPVTYKFEGLRPVHPRDRGHSLQVGEKESTSGVDDECEESKGDPNGFPMSSRFCNYTSATIREGEGQQGVRLNITARTMAVQAPLNWTSSNSSGFFTRHFYRALLQRVFLDCGIVGPANPASAGNGSPNGHTSSGGTAIIIGSLRKGCYTSFSTYVRGALERLADDARWGPKIQTFGLLDVRDEKLTAYESSYAHRKKQLSILWSLMAFSGQVVEAAIIVDRYCWLVEQEEVEDAWVEALFDYRLSPRNLVVVGVKKKA